MMPFRLLARTPPWRWLSLLLVLLVLDLASSVSIITSSSSRHHHHVSGHDARVGSPERCGDAGQLQDPSLPSHGRVALVTGAAGFIGSHVAEYCFKVLGMRVIAVDDLSGGFESNLRWDDNGSKGSRDSNLGSIQFVQGDVRDAKFIAQLFRTYRFDYVYHLAAFAAEGLSHFIRSFIYRNNLVGSTEILNAAIKHNVSCFAFTSSIAVYGASQEPPMSEETEPVPEDPYGISKYAFELDLRAAQRLFDMDYVVFRPHNVYGPRQNLHDPYRNVVGIFFNQLLRGEPMTIFGDGEQLRAFSYIDDVAPLVARGPLIPAARNQVFNVGADEPHSLNALAMAVYTAVRTYGLLPSPIGNPSMTGVFDELPPIKHLPKRVEVDAAFANHSKLRCFFRPHASISLEEGLRRMAAWLRASTDGDTHASRIVPARINQVEVRRHLPPSWDHDGLRETDYIRDVRLAADQTKQPNQIVAHGDAVVHLRPSSWLLSISLCANAAWIGYCCRKTRWRHPRPCQFV